MDLRQFEHLLTRHGADLDRWPAAEQAAARALLAQSLEARCFHAEERVIDQAIHAADPPAPSAQIDRIVANVQAVLDEDDDEPEAFQPMLPPPVRSRWVPVTILGTMAVLGFILGSFIEAPSSAPRQASDLIGLLSSRSVAGFDL